MLGTVNAGVFVKRCRHVMLANPKVKVTRELTGVTHEAGVDAAGAHVTKLSATGRPSVRPNDPTSVVSKTVRVNKGRFAGKFGLVRNQQGGFVCVEITQGQQKQITIPLRAVSVVGAANGRLDGVHIQPRRSQCDGLTGERPLPRSADAGAPRGPLGRAAARRIPLGPAAEVTTRRGSPSATGPPGRVR